MTATASSVVAESDQAAPGAPVPSETVTISQKRKREYDEAEDNFKRCKSVMGSVAEEYACPITTVLPVDPVMAEDGRIYERSAIEKHIQTRRKNLKSPVNNEKMGPKLFPAVQVRNTIKMLVESGTIEGTLAKQWKEQVELDNKVKETRERAEEGDTDAMCDLGDWYFRGINGLTEDQTRAYDWYKKASDLRSVRGMAEQGCALFCGWGIEGDTSYGASLMSLAAGMGSDLGAHFMGRFYKEGEAGFPQDIETAKYWLRKALSSDIKHMDEEDLQLAKDRLKALEDGSE